MQLSRCATDRYLMDLLAAGIRIGIAGVLKTWDEPQLMKRKERRHELRIARIEQYYIFGVFVKRVLLAQTLRFSLSRFMSSLSRGMTATPVSSSMRTISSESDAFSSLHDPLKSA